MTAVKQKVCLIVIDGWGVSDEKNGKFPFERMQRRSVNGLQATRFSTRIRR